MSSERADPVATVQTRQAVPLSPPHETAAETLPAGPRASPWPRVVALLLVLAVDGTILVYFHDSAWWAPDEGNYAHVAERVLDGEVLNRDVQDLHTGYINFLNAASLGLFGRRMVSLRYPLVAAALVQGLLAFYLFRRHPAAMASVAGITVVAVGTVLFLNPTPHWYCLTLFLVLLVSLVPAPSPRRLCWLGLVVGLIFLLRQLTGVFVAQGLLLYLLLGRRQEGLALRRRYLAHGLVAVMTLGLASYLWRFADSLALVLFGAVPLLLLVYGFVVVRQSNRETLRWLGHLSAGGVVAALPLGLYQALYGSLESWLDDVVFDAVGLAGLEFIRERTFTDLLGDLVSGLTPPESAAHVLGTTFLLTLLLAAPAAGTALSMAVARGRRQVLTHPLVVLAAFYALVSVHYAIPAYLFFTASVSLLSVLWLANLAGRRTAAGVAVALLVVAAVALSHHAGQPLHRDLGDLLAGRRWALVPSDTAHGGALTRCGLRIGQQDLDDYGRLVQRIQREVAPYETLFALPSNAELYFLAQRKNPFRFFNTAIGVRSDDDLAQAMDVLRRSPPRLVVFDAEDKYMTPQALTLIQEVERKFEAAGSIGRFQLYLRKRS